MNICKNYLLPCPYALKAWSELPCFGKQMDCNEWRAKYKREAPKVYQNAMKLLKRTDLGEIERQVVVNELEKVAANKLGKKLEEMLSKKTLTN